MENFLGAVGQAVVQEVISRTVSSVLGKRKEMTSQGEYMERLETAVRCMQSVLEATAKEPITEVSLLRQRIELVHGYMEARGVLNKHKKRQAHQEEQQQQQEITTQAITTYSSSGSSPQAQGTRSFARRTSIFSMASSSFFRPMKSRLSCDDIERFERLAGSAQNFLDLVSRCACLGDRIYFSGPLVSHLFQRETLTHKILEGNRDHFFSIRPMIFEGRGVEAQLQYKYTDHERTDEIHLLLQLRLSPSTDIAQVAIKCLQSLVAHFKLGVLLQHAIAALLQLACAQDIVSHAPRWRDPQWASCEESDMEFSRLYRPNPVCCTADEEPCAKESQMFPEEIIYLGAQCCMSGLEVTLPSPPGTTGATIFGDYQRRQLDLIGVFCPHEAHVMDSDLRKTVDSMLEGQKVGFVIHTIAGQHSEPIECSIQEAPDKAIEDFFRMNLSGISATDFNEVYWFSKHGSASFQVRNKCFTNS